MLCQNTVSTSGVSANTFKSPFPEAWSKPALSQCEMTGIPAITPLWTEVSKSEAPPSADDRDSPQALQRWLCLVLSSQMPQTLGLPCLVSSSLKIESELEF